MAVRTILVLVENTLLTWVIGVLERLETLHTPEVWMKLSISGILYGVKMKHSPNFQIFETYFARLNVERVNCNSITVTTGILSTRFSTKSNNMILKIPL